MSLTIDVSSCYRDAVNKQQGTTSRETAETQTIKTRNKRRHNTSTEPLIKPLRGNKWLTIILFAIIAILLMLAYRNAPDNDLYFLLANGREILENGFPYINPWSIYENQGIIIQQWIPSVINYVLYTHYGVGAISLLHVAVAGITAILMWLIGSKVIGFRCDVVALVVFPCVTLMTTYVTVRPHVWTMLFFVITMGILELYRRGASPKILIALPIVACLHANFHSAMMPFDIAAVVAYALPTNRLPRHLSSKFSFNNFKRYPLVITIAAMMLAACINPYGIDGALYLFLSYGAADYQVYISELHPPSLTTWYSYWFLICAGLAILAVGLMSVRREFDTQLTAITVVFFIFGCLHIRNIWLIALVVPLLFSSALVGLLTDIRIARERNATPFWIAGRDAYGRIEGYGRAPSQVTSYDELSLPPIATCEEIAAITASADVDVNNNDTFEDIVDISSASDTDNDDTVALAETEPGLLECIRNGRVLLRDTMLKRIVAVIGLVTVIAAGVWYTYDSEISYHEAGISDNKYTPVKAIEYIQTAAEAIGVDASEFNIFNHFNSGGYLEWCGLSVSMDPRPELWQPAVTGLDEEYYFDYVDMARGTLGVSEYLSDKSFDYLIVDDDTEMAEYLEENDTLAEMVLDGNGYKLYRWMDGNAPDDIIVQMYIEYDGSI